jgi:hypothetical protein
MHVPAIPSQRNPPIGGHFHFWRAVMSGITANVFGNMEINHLMSADQLPCIGSRSTRWQIIEAFIRHSEGNADRLSFGPSGVLLLVGIPGRPNTGAFYLYDERTRAFYTVTFEAQDSFNSLSFDIVATVYDLGRFVDLPNTGGRLAVVPEQPIRAARPAQKRHNRRRRNRSKGNTPVQNNVHMVYVQKATARAEAH